MQGYMEYKSCPICKSEKLSNYDTFFTAPLFIASIEGLSFKMVTATSYIKCDKCGVFIQNPRLNDENLKKYYADGIYIDSLGISEDRIKDNEVWRANSLMKFLEKHKIEPKSHLDIGAARGQFLELTNALYKTKIYGTDLCGKYKDHPMRHAELVSSIHLLEHCPYPRQELEKYRVYCNKYLIVEVPAVNRLAYRFSHLFVFPENVLKEMILNAGFRIIAAEQAPDTRILAEVA